MSLNRIVWIAIIATVFVVSIRYYEDNKTKANQAREQVKIQRYNRWYNSLPRVQIKITEGRSEWDTLNKAGWPIEKITKDLVDRVRKDKANEELYYDKVHKIDRNLRANDLLTVPKYKEYKAPK